MLGVATIKPRAHETGSSSVREALCKAMELERTGSEHYRRLARHVQEPARGILNLLAADGMAHLQALETMLARPEFAAQFDAPAVLRRRIVALPALPADALEDDVLDYAEVREHLAFDMYDRMANLVEPGELHDLLVRLRDRKRQREEEARRCGSALFLIF